MVLINKAEGSEMLTIRGRTATGVLHHVKFNHAKAIGEDRFFGQRSASRPCHAINDSDSDVADVGAGWASD